MGSAFHECLTPWYNGAISVRQRWTLDANLRWVRAHLSSEVSADSGDQVRKHRYNLSS